MRASAADVRCFNVLSPSTGRRGVSRWRRLTGLAILPFVLYALYLVQTRRIAYYEIDSGSMEPTLTIGERWLTHRRSHYQPGDIVVFTRPDQPEITIVKRLIAVGPGTVETRDGQIYVNGHLNRPPQAGDKDPGTPDQPDKIWHVATGEGFVAGDNRPVSEDSRTYGPIPLSRIQGTLTDRVK